MHFLRDEDSDVTKILMIFSVIIFNIKIYVQLAAEIGFFQWHWNHFRFLNVFPRSISLPNQLLLPSIPEQQQQQQQHPVDPCSLRRSASVVSLVPSVTDAGETVMALVASEDGK